MTTFESACDQLVADRIIHALGGQYGALALRATSRRFRALIPAPRRVYDVHEIAQICAKLGDIDACARLLARASAPSSLVPGIIASTAGENGHEALCKFMIDYDDDPAIERGCGRAALNCAACGGHRKLCELIVGWISASNTLWLTIGQHERARYFEEMMIGAIHGNHADLFELAWVWSARYAGQAPQLECAFGTSIARGRTHMSKIIYERAAVSGRRINPAYAMIIAVQYGEVAMCEYLKPLAHHDARNVLCEAIKHDRSTTGELARGWLRAEDPRGYPDAIAATLQSAITWSVCSTIVMVHGWLVEARGREMMLDELCAASIDAASREDPEIRAFFYGKMRASGAVTEAEHAAIARTVDQMMAHAVEENCVQTCDLIHSWS